MDTRTLAQAAALIELIDEAAKAGDVALTGEYEEQLLDLRGWVRTVDGRYRDTYGSGHDFTRHAALKIIRREVHQARAAIVAEMAKGRAA